MIPYTLIREKRRTAAIYVDGGVVTVKAPLRLSKEQIDGFILQKESWINNKLAKAKQRDEKYKSVLDYSNLFYRGNLFRNDNVDLKAAKKWYLTKAKTELKTLLDVAAAELNAKYNSFSLSNAKTRWGSCDGKNNIRLNWRLIMLSEKLQKYVVVHELCHTYYHNHSSDFWFSVQKYLPDYKKSRKELKELAFLTKLFN